MKSLFDLTGKNALVTGASGGLGSSFAQILAAHGATVVLAARRTDKLEAVAARIRDDGGSATTVVMDVTRLDSVQQALAQAAAEVGTMTVVVNNSGVNNDPQPALTLRESDWERVLQTNLKGALLVAQECACKMVDAGCGGSIINITSILGHRVTPGLAPYIAAKSGLSHLSEALALEWARHGIRVNNIAPGYILTDMNRAFFKGKDAAKVLKRIPQRRIGDPSDLNGALLLLASDASSYMTGSTIVVDGGHLQSPL